jgi:phospho-N-acetylmuramoyl-pentapeptide-transferase
MLYNILPETAQGYQLPVAMAFCFVLTFILLLHINKFLPRDGGRAFAVDGEKSAGKPRGAGIIFIPVFTTVASIFAPMSTETGFYLILVLIAMMTGFLDDISKSPWGEYLKGALDLVVAILTTIVFMTNNSTEIVFAVFNRSFVMPPILFGILAVVVIWVSINVTNCSDGVDGLSGSVSIATLMGFFVIIQKIGISEDFAPLILILITGLCAYLWFNATPSKLMMGDAGSRAIGLFIAICALKTQDPFLFLQLALVMLLDGGLGLLKVFLLRFLKIHILKKVRTPLHDHVRKVWGWSNTQCVYRFTIIQIVICATVYFLV